MVYPWTLKEHGVELIPNFIITDNLNAIRESASRLIQHPELQDSDPKRIKQGYLSDRWDLSGEALVHWFPYFSASGDFFRTLRQQVKLENFLIGEAMLHSFRPNQFIGTEWHTDATVSIEPDSIYLVILIYPWTPPSVWPLEVQLKQQKPIQLFPSPKDVVLLSPHVVHRVPFGESSSQRMSIVFRLHRTIEMR